MSFKKMQEAKNGKAIKIVVGQIHISMKWNKKKA